MFKLLKFISKIIYLLEGRFIGVLTQVNFQLLMFPEGLATAFKVALFRKSSYYQAKRRQPSPPMLADIPVTQTHANSA